jgi:hypothetical protein
VPIIHINKVVWFSPNYGVYTKENIMGYSAERVYEMLRIAYDHYQDELLVEACCGGRGPFSDYGEIALDDYLELKAKFEKEIYAAKVTKDIKKENTKIRRNAFNLRRAQLVLLMIETGIPYVCTHEDCEQSKDLTIDHIIPLSKGGSDEVSNLQFMCLNHNSSKGDSM